jgi:hypothetical protein
MVSARCIGRSHSSSPNAAGASTVAGGIAWRDQIARTGEVGIIGQVAADTRRFFVQKRIGETPQVPFGTIGTNRTLSRLSRVHRGRQRDTTLRSVPFVPVDDLHWVGPLNQMKSTPPTSREVIRLRSRAVLITRLYSFFLASAVPR